jgi:protein TonB
VVRRFAFGVVLAVVVAVAAAAAALTASSQGTAPQTQPIPSIDVLLGRLDLVREYYLGGNLAAARQELSEVLTLVREARRAEEAQPAPRAKGRLPRAGRDVEMPGLLHRREPEYPIEAAKNAVTGYVVVDFVIAKSGEVRDARIAHSVPELDRAALAAVREWRFARLRPRDATGMTATTVLTFELRSEAPPTDELDLARCFVERADYASAETPISRAIATLARAVSCATTRASLGDRKGQAVNGKVQPPEKTRDVKPVYPAAAMKAKVMGSVTIEGVMGTNGRLDCLRVLKSIPLLDQAAFDAVSQWEFKPALLAGEPVPVIITVQTTFSLK